MKMINSKQWKFGLMWTLLACCVVTIFLIVGHVDAANTHTICVNLQGRRARLGPEPVAYKITGTESTGEDISAIEDTADANTGVSSGCFDVGVLNSGRYTIEFMQTEETDYLTNFETFEVSGSRTVLDTTLIEGDLNGDNRITGSDSSILSSLYVPGSGLCKNPSDNNKPADLNEDGCVNDTDLNLLKNNLNIFEPVEGETSP